MPLPILPTNPHARPSREDLIRMCYKADLRWCSQVGEETALDVGTAITNAELNREREANVMLDAFCPEGVSPPQAVAMVEEHFRSLKTRCLMWRMNPSMPAERVQPLVDHLLGLGYQTDVHDLMHLDGSPKEAIEEVGGLTIIPARASFRHARELQEESAARWNCPQLAEAGMLHLEDPHCDSVLALKEGKAAGLAIVLAVGEIGQIADVFVSASFRGRGIGRTLMSRAVEICARSLFKHVFLSVEPGNAAAISLYRKFGFERFAESIAYLTRQG